MELEVQWAGANPGRIGRLYQDQRGTVFFEYAPAWRARNIELSPLYLHSYSGLTHTPLRDGLEYGDLIELTHS